MKSISCFTLILFLLVCSAVQAQSLVSSGAPNYSYFTPQPHYNGEDLHRLKAVNQGAPAHPDFGKISRDAKPEWREIYSKRTATTAQFVTDDGEVIATTSYSPIHYRDEKGNYVEINPRLSPNTNRTLSAVASGEGGWAAKNQQYPTYLNRDGSTEISLAECHGEPCRTTTMRFNVNSVFGGRIISLNSYTVGDDGMYVYNALQDVSKRMIFRENQIETDYILQKPLSWLTGSDLVISEEIILPAGYAIKEKNLGDLFETGKEVKEIIVLNSSGEQCATFKVPIIYDNNFRREETLAEVAIQKISVARIINPAKQNVIYGDYHLRKEGSKIFLDVIVPANWLNDPSTAYPVTIDPPVIGPTANWTGGSIPSCLAPTYETAVLNVTVPANITVTEFWASFGAEAVIFSAANVNNVLWYFTTPCGIDSGDYYCNGLPIWGACYMPIQVIGSQLACCVVPSCTDQILPLTVHLGRNVGAEGCNTSLVYYNPASPTYRYAAHVRGRSVEMTNANWSVSPDPICEDVCNLTLSVTPSFGVPPYTISHPWAAANTSTGAHIPASCTSTGTTTLALTRPNCPSPCGTSGNIDVPPPVVIDACGNSVSGLTNKSITMNACGGMTVVAGPDTTICEGATVQLTTNSTGTTYLWSPTNGLSDPNIANPTATPTVTTTYVVTVSDGSGCSGTDSVTIVIGSGLTVNAGPDTTICFGVVVQLTSSGGGTIYLWDSNPELSDVNISNPIATPGSSGARTYYVTVSDGSSCTGRDSVTVMVNPAPIAIVVPPTSTICIGGSVTLTASGGALCLWAASPDLSDENSCTPVATPPLTPGTYTYTVTVTDNGCSSSASADVTVSPAPTITVSPANPQICTGSSIQLTANGPAGTTYFWSPSNDLSNTTGDTVTASPPTQTTYMVVGTDINGCTGSTTVTVDVGGTLNITAGPDTTICLGAAVQLTTTGGGVIFSWDPTPDLDDLTISNPVATPTSPGTKTYIVTASDAGGGCTGTATVTIIVNPVPTVNITPPGATVCIGESVRLTATGGTFCSWTGPDLDNPSFCNPLATPTAPGSYTYTVTITDQGCSSSASVTVDVTPGLTVTASAPQDICRGDLITISANAPGATNYFWTPNVDISCQTCSPTDVYPTVNTTYTVIVSDANNCTGTATVPVTVMPPPLADAGTDEDICEGQSVQLNTNPAGGTTFTWTPSAGLSNPNIPNPVASPTVTTTYVVEVSTAPPCAPVTDMVVVTVHPPPAVDAGNDTTITAGASIDLNATGTGIFYNWTPSTNLSCTACSSPVASPTHTTIYTVITSDDYGCTATDRILIIVEDEFTLYIPNAFTPRRGYNEVFFAMGIGIAEFEFFIFNRWGEVVFQSTDPYLGWDGRFKGVDVQSDVYVYYARAISFGGKSIIRTGTVTVLH